MKVVKHVVVADEAIASHEARISVEEVRIGNGRYDILQRMVHLEVLLSEGVGTLATWKQALKSEKKNYKNQNDGTMGKKVME